ncbi:MAG TPA: hypothetical protein VE574_03790 [Nitrososphaeraceae archaeon]|nr:hypothetical protein [Nitrososphaeraceae archaeon]
MEAVIRTSDVGVLLVTTLELFTVGSSLLYCDNKFRFEGMCLAPIKLGNKIKVRKNPS